MNSSPFQFTIASEIEALGVSGAYFLIEGLSNGAGSPEFSSLRDCVIADVVRDLSPVKIEEDPILKGFRFLHDKVRVSNRKNVASPENLLAMLLRNGKLPSINLIVDIYNLVSCKTRLALGAHDTSAMGGSVSLRLTKGNEVFIPLGSDKLKPVGAGEYCYIDGTGEVICRLEVRQVEKTKVLLETSSCFYIVQGNAATPPSYIKCACEELISLTQRFCGGRLTMLHSCW